MIYWILRHLARIAFKAYFHKIYLINLEHLPREGPVLIAANHPSAFLEACMLAAFLPRHTKNQVDLNTLRI